MTLPVNIAVVGCGAWGRNYVRNLQALPEAKLSWLCDLDPGALVRARDLAPGARCTEVLSRVLADPRVQAVVIATDSGLHAVHAQRALAAGKHVLVEKPMATSVSAARAMVEAARTAGRALMVGHLMVYHPAVAALRGLVRSGALGPLRQIHALRVNPPGRGEIVGPLWSLAPHDLSLIHELLGQRALLLSAWPDALGRVGGIDLQFAGPLTARVQLELAVPRKERTLVVAGAERVAIFDDTRREGKLMVYEASDQAPWPWGPRAGAALGGEGARQMDPRAAIRWLIQEGTGAAQPVEALEPLAIQCRHFLSCAVTGARPRSGGPEGLEVVRLLAAAERSLDGGGAAIDPARVDGDIGMIPAFPPGVHEEMR